MIKKIPYKGEGWGLTTYKDHLIMSDGTSTLTFRDPQSFVIKRKIRVSLERQYIRKINELEMVNDKLYANIWMQTYVLIININSGLVEGVIDFKKLCDKVNKLPNTDVLNGIAYNPTDKSFFITGKNWPKIYNIAIQ